MTILVPHVIVMQGVIVLVSFLYFYFV